MVNTHSLLPVQYSLCLLGAVERLEAQDSGTEVAIGLHHADVHQFVGEYAHDPQVLFGGLRRQSRDEDGMFNGGLPGSDGVWRIPLEGLRE